MEYAFNLKFKLAHSAFDEDELMHGLAEAGCTDALVGLGLPGYVGLDFVREADTAEKAILTAVRDARRGMPGATLVEAGPDFVGLTDVADLLGMSRQNMRKLFVNNADGFPPPMHGGSSMIWHLAQVLQFLLDRHYPLKPGILEVARTVMQVNLVREKSLMDAKLSEKVRRLLCA